MGKVAVSANKAKPHQGSLYKDITTTGGKLKVSKKEKKAKAGSDDEEEEVILDASASRKILQLAREQQEEIENEENVLHKRQDQYSRFTLQQSSDDEDSDEGEDEQEYEELSNFGSEWEDEDDVEVDAEQAAMFDAYFAQQRGNSDGSYNLADKVMAKIAEKQEQMKMQAEGRTERPSNGVSLPPRVIEAYTKVGVSLASWRTGKLPKLFKVLPSVKNWEDLIYVTNPEQWTPQVVYEATKLFVSNLTASKAERFVNMVLYPRFRQDIEEDDAHKLNYHLYRSLKKSIYKPAAFFKGFLMPLVEEECTVREAVIVGSVLSKISIPVLHSAAALGWLLEREFTPATMVFIRVLVEKKYALPYQTIDALVFYFMRFRTITDAPHKSAEMDLDDVEEVSGKKQAPPPLPVVWHKAFLAFAERYKNDITEDQRDFLMEVVRQRGHKDIGPVIRRELLAGQNRLEEKAQQPKDDPMSFF